MPAGLTRTSTLGTNIMTIKGRLDSEGTYEIPVAMTGRGGEKTNDVLTINVINTTGITTAGSNNDSDEQIYDLQGRRLSEKPAKGIVIIVKGGTSRKVFL